MALDDSYLPIQGPPGSGKTYTGAKTILDLVRTPATTGERRVVGITAFSHAAIGQLLREVVKHAGQGSGLRIIQKADEDDWCGDPAVDRVDNREVDARLAAGTVDIVAGTPWLWSRPALAGAVDTLVVDEAGQISLANLAAIGRAARNLVLLGDPQQLSQPVKGAHPPGAERRTRAGARRAPGHPAGARRLPRNHAAPPPRHLRVHLGALLRGAAGDARRPRARGRPGRGRLLAGSGLRWIPVDHTGRASVAPEEVEVVSACVSELLARDWRDRDGMVTRLQPKDVLVVSPYNAQVARLRRALPAGVRTGTVDKFQGQEAPVVIYSMATSTPDDMPRDMSFLFSPNRFNVATSRAQALVILVCNPALLTVACRTPEQMRRANTLAFFVEVAQAQPRRGEPLRPRSRP